MQFPARVGLGLLILALCASPVIAFKSEDFKMCSMAAFCQRLRGTQGDVYAVDPSSVSLTGSGLTAKLANTKSSAQFKLQLTNYEGTVRLHIDEEPSQDRFQVPHALVTDLDKQQTHWDKHTQTSQGAMLQLGNAQVKLQYSPLQLDIAVDGKPAATFNGRQLFNFEHRRQKKEGDPEGWWQETFKSHTDSKPMGPEAISLDLTFHGSPHLYGLPEHATSLSLQPTVACDLTMTLSCSASLHDLPGLLAETISLSRPDGAPLSDPYRLYNLDVFEYNTNSPFGLYGSIPIMLAHKPGLTIGAFWLNSAEMFVDVTKDSSSASTNWVAESGVVDVFFLLGPTPPKVMQQYARLTGTTALPQYFGIAYHQCRWNYRDEADVKAVDAAFDEHNIPYDVIWLDIEHTDGKRYFTWDKNLFPDPAAMQANLASHGRKLVTIIDPHIKRDDNYYIFKEAQSKGFYVNNKDGKEYDGWCWPGSSSYLDMLNPAARDWWAAQFALSKYKGSTKHLYVWNDMNEPSVFNGPEITMPKDNLHHGGVEHRDLHNLNGLLFHMATAQGLEERGRSVWGSDGDRPFVLSRSFFAGSQRVGPIWTGDNAATWDHLRASVPMLLSIGLAGLPFAGADVGGFFGNVDTELLVRWNQVATFYPFFRGHAHLEAKRREPWLFGEDATRQNRAAIRARYALLPYLYTLFWEAHTSGQPIMRPLWYEFPEATDAFKVQSEFMFGNSMLVAPVLEAGAASVEAYLPTGARWFDAHTGQEVVRQRGWVSGQSPRHKVDVTMETIPVFLRGGSIVPRKERARRSTVQMVDDPFTLWVVLDSDGAASGDLYLDDGRSFAFQRGIFAHRRFTFRDGQLSSARVAAPERAAIQPYKSSKYQPSQVIERIVVLGLAGGPNGWQIKLQGSGSTLQAAPGPLLLRPELASSTVALVIRKPDLPVADDWILQFSK